MALQPLKIALIGLGNVGYGLYQILQRQLPNNIQLTEIVVKNKNKPRPIDANKLAYDYQSTIGRTDIDVVVEATDDATASLDIARKTLASGKSLITANKRMLAEHADELLELARKNNVALLFEASAAGAVPVVNALYNFYAHDEVKRVEAILNGTSNYILTQLFQERLSFADAVQKAQLLGYAESDPTLDLNGSDAASKLALLAPAILGFSIVPTQIPFYGISHISAEDVRFAREKGLKIKLLASAFQVDGAWQVSVIPHLVKTEHPLYSIENEQNGIYIESTFSGKQTLSGPGAGGLPTGHAIYGDLQALAHQKHYYYHPQHKEPSSINTAQVEVYVRYSNPKLPVLLGIESISEGFIDETFRYVIGYLPLSVIIEKKQLLDEDQAVLLATGKIRPLAHLAKATKQAIHGDVLV